MKSLHLINVIGMAALAIFVQSNQVTALATQGAATTQVRIGKVEGLVTDNDSNNPLVGAIVTWRANSGEADDNKLEKHNGMQGSTDVLCRFSFAMPLGGRERQEEETSVLVAVQTNVYHPKERSAVVRLGKTTPLNLELEPEPADPIGIVTGKVTNQKTGQGIPDATVTILNAGAVLQATTDDSGTYSIPGVGFHTDLKIRMSTPGESHVPAESSSSAMPCSDTASIQYGRRSRAAELRGHTWNVGEEEVTLRTASIPPSLPTQSNYNPSGAHIWRSHRQMWDIARQRDLHHYLNPE